MIIVGDALEQLRQMSSGSVQTCISSPPYFGLRDYGAEGQIGSEATPDEFVAALVAVFREVRRVLRDDGTVWLNLGDSYGANSRGNSATPATGQKIPMAWEGGQKLPAAKHPYKSKDLLGIPWVVAFALRADGWYLRSDIIWHKPNPMPESVTDRPTKAHEYLFLLSKSPRYFYDADAIREDNAESSVAREGIRRGGVKNIGGGDRNDGERLRDTVFEANGRNKRSVWTVATQPYSGAHFATFPPKLIEPCVLAGSSPKACGVCGAPWTRVVTVERDFTDRPGHPARYGDTPSRSAKGFGMPSIAPPSVETTGWQPSCTHSDDTGRSLILDPFAGSGTVGVVAAWHGRDFIGIELNPTYAEMAERRIAADGRLGRAAKRVEQDVDQLGFGF